MNIFINFKFVDLPQVKNGKNHHIQWGYRCFVECIVDYQRNIFSERQSKFAVNL
jgi:hypothetical protein